MSYSCIDFTEDTLAALKIYVPEEAWDDPEAQAEIALAEIERLYEIEAKYAPLLKKLDAIHASAEAANDMGECFNMLGVLIAKLRGDLDGEEG